MRRWVTVKSNDRRSDLFSGQTSKQYSKDGCPIHLKGAPEVERRRRRGGWGLCRLCPGRRRYGSAVAYSIVKSAVYYATVVMDRITSLARPSVRLSVCSVWALNSRTKKSLKTKFLSTFLGVSNVF